MIRNAVRLVLLRLNRFLGFEYRAEFLADGYTLLRLAGAGTVRTLPDSDALRLLRIRLRSELTPWERRLVEMYDVTPCDRIRSREEFLELLRPAEPAFRHAAASVERNMFRASVGAAALRAGLRAADPEIVSAVERKLAQVPETNWSGD